MVPWTCVPSNAAATHRNAFRTHLEYVSEPNQQSEHFGCLFVHLCLLGVLVVCRFAALMGPKRHDVSNTVHSQATTVTVVFRMSFYFMEFGDSTTAHYHRHRCIRKKIPTSSIQLTHVLLCFPYCNGLWKTQKCFCRRRRCFKNSFSGARHTLLSRSLVIQFKCRTQTICVAYVSVRLRRSIVHVCLSRCAEVVIFILHLLCPIPTAASWVRVVSKINTNCQ